eukprot:TRINITY_DN11785_c0_g1_i1.p1 TRINITY_DN11785_c0_g1~~TRINITY_DN11785_c0_g1_i1.p1  ORF type:complete len:404 (+),score=38.01 TRINITY_DN11785_c0_g1_i1:43-1254(+)
MDTFGLNDLLGEVAKPGEIEEAEKARCFLTNPGEDIFINKPFGVGVDLLGASGSATPIDNGYEAVLSMTPGRLLKSKKNSKQGNSAWIWDRLEINDKGDFTITCTVTSPDKRRTLKADLSITVQPEEEHDDFSESMSRAASVSSASSESLQVLPPTARVTTYSFVHRSDHDKHGVLYYLGLNKMKSKKWRNPVDRGLVAVTTSSLRKGSLSDLVERRPTNQVLCTEDNEESWIMLDLKNHVCAPNAYTLSGRCDKSRDVLKSWTLEGSMNGKLWVVIHTHFEDLSLNQNRLKEKNSFSWKVPQSKYYFRYFRLKIGDKGNTSKTNVLAATCMELYGLLRKRKQCEAESTQGVPLPLEQPILEKLNLSIKGHSDWQDMVKRRYSLPDRKRAAEERKKSAKKSKK